MYGLIPKRNGLPSSLKVASVATFVSAVDGLDLWSPRAQAATVAPVVDEDDEDLRDEYDFIGTAVIPAKLDLARAYMDMDDCLAAQQVLTQVLQECQDESYQRQAKHMLAQINEQ